MKVYDGAALIAAHADAAIVPVRISGLEATPFSRLEPGLVRRRWFPKVRVAILEPRRLPIEPGLSMRPRREAGGLALHGVLCDLIWRTARTDITVFQAVAAAARIHGPRADRRRGSHGRHHHLSPPADGSRGARAGARAPVGAGRGRWRADAERECVDGAGAGAGLVRPRAGDAELHRRNGQPAQRLPRRADPHHRHLAGLHRARTAGKARRGPGSRGAGGAAETRLSGGRARPHRSGGQDPGHAAGWPSPGPPSGRRSCGDRLHLGVGGDAQGRRAQPPQHAGEHRPGGRRASITAARTRCSTSCRCSTPSASPAVSCCRWSMACRCSCIPRRCTTRRSRS